MEINLRAGRRVLFKEATGNNWQIGDVCAKPAIVNTKGVWFSILPIGAKPIEENFRIAEINNIFYNATELQDWMHDELLTKEEYLEVISDEEFDKKLETAWFSDGEYVYYPVSKFNENWIMKQPFEYIIRGLA